MTRLVFLLGALTMHHVAAATPPPHKRRVDYTKRGAIEVDTNENSIFLWHGNLFVLENIPCYYSQHNSKWNASYANASYARIRRMDNGALVTNVSLTIGFGFVSAFVDEDFDRLWLFGSAHNRCGKQSSFPHPGDPHLVQAWWTGDPTMKAGWSASTVDGTRKTFNVEVARVRADAAEQASRGLPPHGYVMILETGHDRFRVSNATNGDLTKGWVPIPDAQPPEFDGGASIRWNALDGYYYSIEGGTHVYLQRTKDFTSWESSPNAPFIEPSQDDAQVSNIVNP